MSKIITDEQELNTAIGDLVTEDYALEILGLQSIADFRKFSRSFMKLSKIVKEVETNVDNNLDEKLDKGAVSSDYDTAKKIEDKIKKIIDEKWKINTKYIGNTSTSTDFNSITANGIYYSSVFNSLFTNGFLGANQQAYSELKLIVMGINNDDSPALKSQLVITRSNDIYLRSCTAWQAPWTWSEWIKIAKMSDVDEKFKNFCPFKVGDIYVTTNSANPSSVYLGTTWSKIEGRFLLGTSGGGASKQTGGSMAKTIQQGHLPNVKLRVDSFGLTLNPPNIDLYNDYGGNSESGRSALATEGSASKAGWTKSYIRINSAGSTGTASPWTSALGSGWGFDVTPSYYTTHMWLRTS